MALTKQSLSLKLRSKLMDFYKLAPPPPTSFCSFCDAIAEAVVDEIKANAEVTVIDVKSGKDIATGTVR